ncbi:MAG: TRAP transporter substrate-binding protein, partial [Geminicoccaceae bacterium]
MKPGIGSTFSRRDLFKSAGAFGWTSTLLAAGAMAGGAGGHALAQAAGDTLEKRFSKPPKFQLRFGASGFNEKNLLIERAGCLEFVRDLEERTDGAIRVEFIGSNQLCGQLDCVQKASDGTIDIFAASTQNSAASAPYLNVLDYAYMFPTRASQYHFMYHPGSQAI